MTAEHPVPLRDAAQDHARPLVLVADDDPDMCEEIARTLHECGYSVIAVATGEHVLDYLVGCAGLETGRAPDVIISDIRMSDCSGLEVLQAIRAMKWDIPIILMTSFGDEETHTEARRLGALATFDKPFDGDDLRTALLWVQWLGRSDR